MANKEKVDLSNLNFDLEEDWGKDPFSPQAPDNKKSGRNPVEKAGRTVLKEMGKATITRTMAKRILEGALPQSFTVMSKNIDSSLTDTRNLMNTVKRDAQPMVREFKSLGRSLNNMFPSRYRDKINSLLAEKNNGYGTSNYNMEDVAAEHGVNAVFGPSREEKASAAEESGRELAKELTDQEFKKRLGGAVSSIQDLLARQTSYNFSVQRGYQKKMMELQIRQLMTSRAQLDVTQKAAVETSNLLRNIVENTGLPDVVKVRRSEEFMRMSREKIYGKIQGKLSDWTRNYREQLGQRINDTARHHLSRFGAGLSMANQGIEAYEQQREQLERMGIDPSEFAASMAGQQGALWLGTRVGKYAAKKIPGLARTDGAFSRANYLFNNKERLAAEYGRSGYQYGKWYHPATNFLKDTLRSTYQDGGSVRRPGLKGVEGDLTEGAVLQLRASEETNGYLSRILHSIEKMRTGNDKIDRTVFNTQKGTFTSFTDSVADVRQSLLGQGEIDNQRTAIERLYSQIDPTGKLKGSAKESVIKFLYQRSRTSRAFNPGAMANESIPGLTNDDKITWQGLLATRYGLTLNNENKWTGNIYDGRNQNLNRDAGEFNYASNQTVGLFNRAHALSSTGNLEQLIHDGAVVFKKGEWVLNKDYYDKRVNGNETASPGTGETGHSSEIPNAPRPGDRGPSPLPNATRRFNYFGDGYPHSVNPTGYHGSPMGGGQDQRNSIQEALAAQIDRIIDTLKPHHLLVAETLPEIEAQLERIQSLGVGSGQHESSEGSPEVRRRRRFHRMRQLLSAGGRGVKSYWNLTGAPFKAAGWLARKAKNPLMFLGTGGLNKVGGYLRGLGTNLKDQVGDGYIRTRDGLKKVIDKEGLRAGRYIDQKTGQVITKLSEIKGAVWDTLENTQVLTEEDALGGVLTSAGKRIKTHALGLLSKVGSLAGNIIFPRVAVGSLLKRGSNLIKGLLNRLPDVYVTGETTPRLYASKLAKGLYYQVSTGKRVTSLNDLTGDIGTIDPTTGKITPVLTGEEISRGLSDRNGKALKSPLGKLGHLTSKLLTLPFAPVKLLGNLIAGAGRLGKNVLHGAGNLLGRFAGVGTGTGIGRSGNYLKKIYRLLLNQFTGKNPTDGLENDPEIKGKKGFRHLFNRAAGRTSDYLKDLGGRTGSWVNRIKGFGNKTPEHKEEVKKAEAGGGWGKLIFSVLGGIGTGFKSFFSWIKDLPKWLALKKGTEALGDAAGDLAGGGKGKKGGLLRRAGRLGWKAVKGVGKVAIAAGSFLGRGVIGGALRLAGGIGASLLSAPALITAAVVAGAGYLIYKGWKAYSNRMTDLREYRVAQYGSDPKDSERSGKLLALEEAVLNKTKVDGNGKAVIGAMSFEELITAFGIEMDDQRSVLRWSRWFKMRFSPIFLRNVEVLYRMDPKAKLTDASFLREGQRPQFARDTFFESAGENSPYGISDSPFPQGSSYVGKRFPQSFRDKIIAAYSTKELADKKKGHVQQSVLSGQGKAKVSDLVPRRTDITNAPIASPKGINAASDLYFSPGDRVDTPGGITGNPEKDELIQIGNRIDDLTSIRTKTYGLGQLLKDRVNTLLNFEKVIYKDVRIGAGGVSKYQRGTDDIFHQSFGQFGINPQNADEKNRWTFWFEHRFLPTFLNFISQTKKVAPNVDPFNAWQRLSSADLLSIAQRINQSITMVDNKNVSVWTITASPWPNTQSGTDASVIQTNLDAMRDMSKKEVYAESLKTKAEMDKMTFDGKALKQTAVGNKIYDFASDVKNATSNNALRASGANGQGAYAQHYASTGTSFDVSGAGADYVNDNITHIGDGTGGSVNTLPNPQGDGWVNTKDLIVAAAKMAGVDAGSLAAFIAIESNFKATAGNGTSSAKGLGQFTRDTWKGIMPLLVKKYGINPNTQPTDPRASALATAEYMKQNANYLKNLGRPLTTTDLYMAHFLGAGDAKKVLGASSDTSIQEALGGRYNQVATANKNIFEGVNTTGDLIRKMGQLVAQKGGGYIDEANSLASRGASGGNAVTTPGGTGEPGPMGSQSVTAPVAGASTPKTPPIPAAVTAKSPLPTGDASSGASYSRTTDLTPSTAVRPGDSDAVVAAQTVNSQIAGAQTRAVSMRQRNQNTETSSRIQQGNDMNTSLGVLRSIDTNISTIAGMLKSLVDKKLTGDTGTNPNNKGTPEQQLLNGSMIRSPDLRSKQQSKMPFNTSTGSAEFK